MNSEQIRLDEARTHTADWKLWGPYLSERAWATVREDYSRDGSAWTYFPHDQARSKAYRWGEDGLAGISDRKQILCFALALWNGRDPFLKERAFGLTGQQGNHGEDVKEYYFYLDNTPTHSYMKYLYKYPQREFPYALLVEENGRRARSDPEFELLDTGVFDENRYFDVLVEYAKKSPEDIFVRITAKNRGPEAAELHLLPTIWFRNRWAWGIGDRPSLSALPPIAGVEAIEATSAEYGSRWLYGEGTPDLLFTENDTNTERLHGVPNRTPYVKDGIDARVVHGSTRAVNPELSGTKASFHYRKTVEPGGAWTIHLRLSDIPPDRVESAGLVDSRETFETRQKEADQFYDAITPHDISNDAERVMRQALAGMLWNKQFYYYTVREWLTGDPGQPAPPRQRIDGRNHEWTHLYNDEVVSVPDKWEFPWYASWDLAFHCIPLSLVDPDFAKSQLVLLLREWYLHPNGQIPAYEWSFDDVNPPVHAWAAWRVYEIERKRKGVGDLVFLEKVFHKLLLNFTWWVNRQDAGGNNVFEGGFLGLDNIGVFDRGAKLPTGGFIEQADGTAWMGMYCLNLLAIAIELALHDGAYEDVASKFLEHFLYMAHAINHLGSDNLEQGGVALWDEQDGFFYDVLHMSDGHDALLKVRSMVGLIPIFAVETIEPATLSKLPGFRKRMEWFLNYRKDLQENIASMQIPGMGERRLLSIIDEHQLLRILKIMLDEAEFLSPHGIRSLSRYHKDSPYSLWWDGYEHRVDYDPAESRTEMFGGNSNWRGPIWFPMNYLIIEALQKFHYYFGSRLKVEFPTGSGHRMDLWQVSQELSRRLTRIFLHQDTSRVGWVGRPVFGTNATFQSDPYWRSNLLFYEYFDGDTGAGCGASHQTGWTGLVAKLIQQSGE